MKNIIVFILLALLSACQGNVGGHHHHDESEEHHHGNSAEIVIEPEKAEKLGIKTIKTEYVPFGGIITASGRIESDNSDSWDIVANISGLISFTKKNIGIGSYVSTSEHLFSISSDKMNSQNHSVELAKCKAELTKAENLYSRLEYLRQEKLATEDELIKAKTELEVARADYDRTCNAVGSRLSTPHNGYITSLYIENGQYVEEGQSIATISAGKEILIVADVPARYALSIKEITGANYSINGKIYSAGERISGSDIIASNGTTIPIHFKAEKVEGIAVGMPIEVILKLSNSREVLTLPKSAIAEKYGKYYSYIKIDEECYKEIEISLGASDGYSIEITSGLESGLEVVSEGVYYVKMSGSNGSIPHGHSH